MVGRRSSLSPSNTRGQAEPNVALIAIAFLVIALGLFAGYHQGISQDQADRAVASPTLDNVYNGATDTGRFETTTALSDLLEPSDLPRGHAVYVTVTYLDTDTGNIQTVDQAYFDEDGRYMGREVDNGYPNNVQNASRPIAISPSEGDDHGGRLTVRVWKNQ